MPFTQPDSPFVYKFSLAKLCSIYREQASDQGTGLYFRALLTKINCYPEFLSGICGRTDIRPCESLIEEFMAPLFPAALTANEIKAAGFPYQSGRYNLTVRFRSIIRAAGQNFEPVIRDFDHNQYYIFNCCLILSAVYATDTNFIKPLFMDIPASDGFMKHYKVLYNTDYIEVLPGNNHRPLTEEDIVQLLDNYDNLSIWKEKFPPGSWILKGFSLISLVDVTTENAISVFKESLMGKLTVQQFKTGIEKACQSIFQQIEISAGFSIFNTQNQSWRPFAFAITSDLLNNETKSHTALQQQFPQLSKIIRDRSYMTMPELSFIPQKGISPSDKDLDGSYILSPVFIDDRLVGILELRSRAKGGFNSITARRLDLLMPFLAEPIDRILAEHQHKLRAVIQANYTAIHPSVYWRFEQEAGGYIKALDSGGYHQLKEITFTAVYPFYGQVDIHNSSVTRNACVGNDLAEQVTQAMSLLSALAAEKAGMLRNNITEILTDLLTEIRSGLRADTEYKTEQYLENFIMPLFRKIPGTDPLSVETDSFIRDSLENDGKYYRSRRDYEQTVTRINEQAAGILDKRQSGLQPCFPHYFERFKSDGVEHNLYAGRAITPNAECGEAYFAMLRFWQLLVTVEMVAHAEASRPDLPLNLGLTTLILVFSIPINIRFRMDEKHFDIDGAYSIRYEVIKKRIDKARMKNNGERITRERKLTIVYSKAEEGLEYRGYLNRLQQYGLLGSTIENFEIEDLQGVTGLLGLSADILTGSSIDGDFDQLYDELLIHD